MNAHTSNSSEDEDLPADLREVHEQLGQELSRLGRLSAEAVLEPDPGSVTLVREALASARARQRRRRLYLGAAFAALAASIAAVLVLDPAAKVEPPARQWLDGRAPFEAERSADGELVLKWTLAPGEYNEVRIHASSRGEPGALLAGPFRAEGQGWSSGKEASFAGADLVVEVSRFDANGDLLGIDRVEIPPGR